MLSDDKEKAQDIIEILWIAIPTCFKIFSGRMDSTISLASTTVGKINQFLADPDDNVTLLKAKLHLFIMGVSIHQKQDAATLFNAVLSEIELIERLRFSGEAEEWYSGVHVGTNFTKAYFLYKLKKGLFTNADRIPVSESETRFHNIGMLLKHKCDSILKKLGPSYDFERSAVTLMVCKTRVSANKWRISEQFQIRLRRAAEVFASKNCKKLEMKSHYSIAELQLQ